MTSLSDRRSEPLPDDAPHVLIVDDDHKIRDLLARYLYSQGFRVTTAADAEMAQASLRGLDFDIVLLDVMMPGISGLELARQIKAVRDIPICMLTARAEPEQRIEGLAVERPGSSVVGRAYGDAGEQRRPAAPPQHHIRSGAEMPSSPSERAIVRIVSRHRASRACSTPSPSAPTTWQSR